ncbi:MAG: hypothetical protein I8H75_04255 [Myxococcaceae bacterium]|nr:hypothetical protein [Myxococcaceae bacterium]MBH2006536.1 hypothetical protein [Myxococcaceae bacterium]
MWILLAIFVGLVVLTCLLALGYPLRGTWERVESGNQSIWERDRITLNQFGFLVWGHQNLPAGVHRYWGFCLGPHLFLNRRDYGFQLLKNEGFPEKIIPLVQGRILMRYRLRLSSDRLTLCGQGIPMKVEFFEESAQIKQIRPVEPVPRSYQRLELIPARPETISAGAKPVYDA